MKDERFVIPELPAPGSQAWEDMADFMRKDMASGFQLSKIKDQAKDIVEADGRDFVENAKLWNINKGHEIMRKKGAVLYPTDIEILKGSRNRAVRVNKDEDRRVKELYDMWRKL